VVASAGGHWVQLTRLWPAWSGAKLTVMTTKAGLRAECLHLSSSLGQPAPDFYVVPEANRWNKFRLILSLISIFWVILKVRPDIVITTGAAPGYFAVRVASLLGSRTVWIDSIANAEELSLSGKKAGAFVDLWLTQWPNLEHQDGPTYKGSVL
jgi:hypothetical protein